MSKEAEPFFDKFQAAANYYQQVDLYKIIFKIVQNCCVQIAINKGDSPEGKALIQDCMYQLMLLVDEETFALLNNQPGTPWQAYLSLINQRMVNDVEWTVRKKQLLKKELLEKRPQINGGGLAGTIFKLLALFPCVTVVTKAIIVINNTVLSETVERALIHHDVSAYANNKGICSYNARMGGMFATQESVLNGLSMLKDTFNEQISRLVKDKLEHRKTTRELSYVPLLSDDIMDWTFEKGEFMSSYKEIQKELKLSLNHVEEQLGRKIHDTESVIHQMAWYPNDESGEGHAFNLITSSQYPDQGIIADPNGQSALYFSGTELSKYDQMMQLTGLFRTDGFGVIPKLPSYASSPYSVDLKSAFLGYEKYIRQLYNISKHTKIGYTLNFEGPVFVSNVSDAVHVTHVMRKAMYEIIDGFEKTFHKLNSATELRESDYLLENDETTLQRFNASSQNATEEVLKDSVLKGFLTSETVERIFHTTIRQINYAAEMLLDQESELFTYGVALFVAFIVNVLKTRRRGGTKKRRKLMRSTLHKRSGGRK